MVGDLYLVPSPISESGINHIAAITRDIFSKVKLYFVENQKNARRFIKELNPEVKIDSLQFIDIGKYADQTLIDQGFERIWMGENAAVLSDAGLPGVGDPGYQIVQMAHSSGVKVKPIAGPNSFTMALMASGLNGQQFRFHGYLPIDKKERRDKLKDFSAEALKTEESQIFMDTPYRNQQVLDDILKVCPAQVLLNISQDISGENESVLTLSIADWRKMKKKLQKIPAVFILGYKSNF